MAPVVFHGGVPDVLLRFAKCWRRVNRHEFIVAADQEVTGMKVTMQQDGAPSWPVVARDGIGKGDDSILMPLQ